MMSALNDFMSVGLITVLLVVRLTVRFCNFVPVWMLIKTEESVVDGSVA